MVDNLGCLSVPVLRSQVDVRSEVDVPLVQFRLDLYKGGPLAVELLLAVVHKAVTYLLHSFFEVKL